MSSSKLSNEKKCALNWIFVGLTVAMIGACGIWGLAAAALVVGIFVTVMSMADYWKAP